MRVNVPTAALLAGAVGLSPASATPPKLSPNDQARKTMRVYAACLLADARGKARHDTLVTFLSASRDEGAASVPVSKLVRPGCLTEAGEPGKYVASFRVSPRLLRGALYRALYLDEVDGGRAPAIRPGDIAFSSDTSPTSVDAQLRAFGDCVVAADATTSVATIKADVASEAEAEGYKALAPIMSRCADASQDIRFSKATLEGIIASALFRKLTKNSHAAPLASAGKQ